MTYRKILRMKNSVRLINLDSVEVKKKGRLKQYHMLLRIELTKLLLNSYYNGNDFIITLEFGQCVNNKIEFKNMLDNITYKKHSDRSLLTLDGLIK